MKMKILALELQKFINRQGYKTLENDVSLFWFAVIKLKAESASHLEAERSEVLNSGGTQQLKTLFNESFSPVASNRCYTTFCQFF